MTEEHWTDFPIPESLKEQILAGIDKMISEGNLKPGSFAHVPFLSRVVGDYQAS